MLGIILGTKETGQPRLGCTGYADIEHSYSCLKDGQVSCWIYDREKRSLKIGKWTDDKLPLERMTEYYGLATWVEDGSWGYQTPIYMLNRIIRLQAVLEILINETRKALSLLAQQETQMRNADRLALDYLLAAEGGICGKFNLTNCCLHIVDQGQAVEDIVRHMTKLAHMPVQ
ncbi:LOW QUALITY PROTEIN: Endogenous retrovirus group 3 member 1 Env polyprotein, partial [Plecturocebus cupreus]